MIPSSKVPCLHYLTFLVWRIYQGKWILSLNLPTKLREFRILRNVQFFRIFVKKLLSRSLNMSLNTSSCIYTDVFIGSHAALLEISDKLFFTELTLLWRGRYHIETICSANQWTGFYRLTASIMKELSAIKFPLAEEHLLRGLYAL